MRFLLRLRTMTTYRLANGSLAIEADNGGEVTDEDVAEILALVDGMKERRQQPNIATKVNE